MARRLIKRKSAVKVSRIEGSIVDTTNIKDKKKNTYSANVIEKLIEDNVPDIEVPTKTSQLINDSGFITSALKYSDFVVQAHSVHANYISAGQSNTFSATITNAGYYPLAIAAPASYSHTNAGFTVNPLRITYRGNGTGTIQYWARNDANGSTNWTNAYIDVLWVKM